MRVDVIDPSAYTPPYDHALCAALAAAGAQVQLLTSRFPYGSVEEPVGYRRREVFYRRAHSTPVDGTSSGARLALKLAEHLPGMLRCRAIAANADIAHYQWLPLQHLDGHMLPGRRRSDRRPKLVITAHDVLPREPRPGQLRAQRLLYRRFDAIVVHSQHGAQRLTHELGVAREKVHVIRHGAFAHLAAAPVGPPPFDPDGREPAGPVVLFFGLLRPYKGLDVLLEAWRRLAPWRQPGAHGRSHGGAREHGGAQLWIAGMPRKDLAELGLAAAKTPAGIADLARQGIHVKPQFIAESDLPAYFARADLVVLPYREIDQSGVLFTALAFGKPLLLSDVGGFPEIADSGAAVTVSAGDVDTLAASLRQLLQDSTQLAHMAAAARAAAEGPYSWREAAAAHLELYERLLCDRLGENGAARCASSSKSSFGPPPH